MIARTTTVLNAITAMGADKSFLRALKRVGAFRDKPQDVRLVLDEVDPDSPDATRLLDEAIYSGEFGRRTFIDALRLAHVLDDVLPDGTNIDEDVSFIVDIPPPYGPMIVEF